MPLDQSAGDPGGRRALPGRDDDAHAVVAAASHGATAGVHHEADQEPAKGKKKRNGVRRTKRHGQKDRRKLYHGHK